MPRGVTRILFLSTARDSVVDWDTMLQAGRSRVRAPMRYFLNLYNLSSRTIGLWSTQPLTELSARKLPGGEEGGRRVRLTNLPPSVSRLSRENVGPSTSHNPMGLHGLLHGYLYFTSVVNTSFQTRVDLWNRSQTFTFTSLHTHNVYRSVVR
jgi:hypothetical protein